MGNKPLVIIESPFSGDIQRNIEYARACVKDSLLRGEAPFASHLLYTQAGILDDTDPDERELGIGSGLEWLRGATLSAVYTDLGVSPGMLHGIEAARQAGITIEYRNVDMALPGLTKPGQILSRDIRFLQSAKYLAKVWSKDPSSQVCAIAVGERPNQVAWGYNGFPPGIADTPERLNDRGVKYPLTVHAEPNALFNATFPVKTLYVTHHPCDLCAPLILAARTVERIVFVRDFAFETRWAAKFQLAKALFHEAGVKLEGVDLEFARP